MQAWSQLSLRRLNQLVSTVGNNGAVRNAAGAIATRQQAHREVDTAIRRINDLQVRPPAITRSA